MIDNNKHTSIGSLSGLQTQSPVGLANAKANALNPVSKIGDAMVDKGVSLIEKQQQRKAINQAYEDAAAGKFGTISGLTGANETYNAVMDKVAPAVITSKANNQLEELYNSIKSSPNFNPATATQEFAKGAKSIISTYQGDSLPENWRGEIGINLQKMGMQYGLQMNKDVLSSIVSQQTSAALQAKDDLFKQITQAASLGNTGLAHDLNQQYSTLVQQGITAGYISPKQANNMMQDAKDEMQLQGAIRSGVPIADNPQLEAKRLSIYSQQQKAIEVNQLQNHYDFNAYLTKSVLGIGGQPPAQMSDEQIMQVRQASQASSYLSIAKNGNTNVLSSAGFLSLDHGIQSLVKSQLIDHEVKKSSNPDIALGMQGKGLGQIANAMVVNNMPLKDITKTQRFVQLQNAYATDPVNTIKAIQAEAGPYSQQVLSKMGVKDGASLAIDKVTNDPVYLSGLSSANSARTFRPKDYDGNTIDAMNNMGPNSQQAVQQYVHTYSKANPTMKLKDIIATKFDNTKINGHRTYVYNEDAPILNDSDNIAKIKNTVAKSSGINPADLDGARFALNIQGNSYNVIDSNNRLVGVVHRSDIAKLPPKKSLFERVKDAL